MEDLLSVCVFNNILSKVFLFIYPFPKPLYTIDLLKEYKENQIKNGKTPDDNDYIFQTIKLDMLWNPSYINKEWARFVKKFKLKEISVYDIRHSHATYLLSIGVPIQDVSRRLGHSDIITTLKTYTHSNLEQDKKIADLLEDNLYSDYMSRYAPSKKVLNYDVISSIITGINFTDELSIIVGLEYLTNTQVNEKNYKEMMLVSRDYLLDKYDYLNNIRQIIDQNTSESTLKCFFDLLNNLQPEIRKVNPIMDINYYLSNYESSK